MALPPVHSKSSSATPAVHQETTPETTNLWDMYDLPTPQPVLNINLLEIVKIETQHDLPTPQWHQNRHINQIPFDDLDAAKNSGVFVDNSLK